MGPIQDAVVAYYSQFEDPGTEGSAAESAPEDSEPGAALDEPGEPGETGEVGEVREASAAQAEIEAGAVGGDVEQTGPPVVEEPVEEPSEPGSEAVETVSGAGPETVEQFGTIGNAGSPHKHAEGVDAESVPEKQ